MTAELMVRVVGALGVCRAGRPLAVTEVGSRKARTLLALLAVRRGHLSVDRITHVLWGDALPRDPAGSIATLVSRLRAALGRGAVAGDRTGYRLGRHVRIDLYEADDLVSDAEAMVVHGQPRPALAAVRLALSVLGAGGVLVEVADAGWAEPARALHSNLLRRARHVAADAALRIGDTRSACQAAEAAVRADAFDEAAGRMLMRAHVAADEPARALIVYERLRKTLATELGIEPAAPTRELHLRILRQNRV